MEETKHPLVSIVMATYNRASKLEQTIQNIYDQDYINKELVIVNDGSKDETTHVLKALARVYPILIIENTTNLGLQKSLNIGFGRASGKYVARIDDHDKWITKDKLSKQVALMESNPKIGLVGTGYKTGDKAFINPLQDQKIREQILMRCPFCHVSIMMSKSIFDQVGGYDESLGYSEDWDLWLRLGRSTKMANLPDLMVVTEEEESSLSGSNFTNQLPINRKIVSNYYKDYPGSQIAFLYHQLIRFFFAIVPLNSWLHRLMKGIFQRRFNLTKSV